MKIYPVKREAYLTGTQPGDAKNWKGYFNLINPAYEFILFNDMQV